MRYDKPIFFVDEMPKVYDPDLGNWSKAEQTKTKVWANVTHMSAERQQKIFGDVCSERFVLRLQRPYLSSYKYIEMNGKCYYVDTERCPGDKESLVVIENG